MIPPIENQLKPVETGSSNRENLISLDQSKTDQNSIYDLDIRKESGEYSIRDML